MDSKDGASPNDVDRTFRFFLASRAFRSVGLIFVTLAIPLYLFALRYSLITIGLIYFVIISFNVALVLLLGAFGDRVGYKKALIVGEFFPLAALILLALSTNIYYVITAAIIGGVAGVAGGMRGTFSPGSTALIVSNWHGEKDRVNRFGKITAVGSAASIFGALLLSFHGFLSDYISSVYAFRLFFGVSAFFVFLSLISLFFVKEVRRPKKTTRIMKKSSFKYSFRVIIANIVNGFGLGIALPLLPLWFSVSYGVNTTLIGYLYMVSYASTSIGGYIASRSAYSEKFSALNTASYTRSFMGIALVGIALSPFFAIAGAIFVVRSLIAGIGSPSRSAVNLRGVDTQDYGTASSAIGVANRLSLTSSGLSGYLMDVSLPSPMFLGGIMQIFGGLLYLRILKPKNVNARGIKQGGRLHHRSR